MTTQDGLRWTAPTALSLEGLTHHQVLQRQSAAGIELAVPSTFTDVEVFNPLQQPVANAANGSLWLPTGGPYRIAGRQVDGQQLLVHDVLVGDLWVLAGQSNMQGCARLTGRELPQDRVRVLDVENTWRRAEEPLHMHWLPRAHPVHARLNKERAEQPPPPGIKFALDQLDLDEPAVNGHQIGCGPGVSFGNELLRRTGVPVGLLAAAHAGSSMAQWDPQLPDGLFDALLCAVHAAGGRVAGVLWYQGESDAGSNPNEYATALSSLIHSLRNRTSLRDMKVLLVQLGRFVIPHPDVLDLLWSGLREAQRTCEAADGITTAVDLGLEDPIHLSTDWVIRVGRRLARLAAGHPSLQPSTVELQQDGLRVVVNFEGVASQLRGDVMPQGFSIRDAAGVDQHIVFGVDVRPTSVRLRLSRPAAAGDQLWYGYGMDPCCTLTDAEDVAVPAFGPLPLVPEA